MARLAQLERGQRPSIRTKPQMVQRYFGLGLLGGGLVGIAAIVALPYVAPEHSPRMAMAASSVTAPPPVRPVPTPAPAPREAGARPAKAAPAVPAPSSRASTSHAATAPPGPPPLSMDLTRSARGTSPFPLEVTGVTDPDNARVIVRDLPKTARLSSGERRDERTWALRIPELNGLQVSLGESTPEVFDIVIEIASVSGAQLFKTSARVRLKPGDAPSAPRRLPASIEDLLRESKAAPATPATPAAIETPFRTEVTSAEPASTPAAADRPVAQAAAEPAAAPPAPERKSLPDGRSALGGPANGQAQGPAEETRQVWWKLPTSGPAPAWAPFGANSGQ
jgi:hypothetical protein